MWRELKADLREMWWGALPLERPLLALFVPIYCLAFVLAYVFGED